MNARIVKYILNINNRESKPNNAQHLHNYYINRVNGAHTNDNRIQIIDDKY